MFLSLLCAFLTNILKFVRNDFKNLDFLRLKCYNLEKEEEIT